MKLSTRALNSLWMHKTWDEPHQDRPESWVPDIEWLADQDAIILLRTPNLGLGTIKEIREFLADHGRTFKRDLRVANRCCPHCGGRL